jgi:branched-subunit amino acid transport protein
MREMLPPTVESALRYAPACALAAIVANDLLFAARALDLSLHNPRWLAGGVAIIIFAANRRTIGVIASEMAAFWLLRAWFSG